MNYYFSNTQGQIERLTIIEKFENNPNTPPGLDEPQKKTSVTTPIPHTIQPANGVKLVASNEPPQ